MKKNVVIFYDSEPAYISAITEFLQENGFNVEVFISAEDLLERLVKKTSDICLIISELIVEGEGNNFRGKRKDFYQNCALYLLDEFDCSISKDEISEIPKIIFTSWSHTRNGIFFQQMLKDPRVKKVLKKSDIGVKEFLLMIKELTKGANKIGFVFYDQTCPSPGRFFLFINRLSIVHQLFINCLSTVHQLFIYINSTCI